MALSDIDLGPLLLPREYVPLDPTVKQEWFLRHDCLEAFFGGSAGPGKSTGLLMAAAQYVTVGGYHALLLRKTLREFEMPGGLVEKSHEWFGRTNAWWNGTRREWAFPSGATLRFGYLSTTSHLAQYKGAEASFVGFDELTSFQERLYRGMFRVLRQVKDSLPGVPLRMRSASNPGDTGHEWVKTRFVNPRSRHAGVVFVRATIHDNPYLDYEEYLLSLAELDPVERMRLINGDWDVTVEGGRFKRDDWSYVDEPPPAVRAVRYWDLAASEQTDANPDPDWTVGLRLDVDRDGVFTVRHIARGRWRDSDIEAMMRATAELDGPGVQVYVEQEPGASGKLVVGYIQRQVLQGFAVHPGLTRSMSKDIRARPVAAAQANHLVRLVRGPNVHELVDEAALFPLGAHDDIVDALSGAHYALTRTAAGVATIATTRARIPGVDELHGQTAAVRSHGVRGRPARRRIV